MSGHDPIEMAVRAAGLAAPIRRRRDLTGGCIHRVAELALADGSAVVAKVAAADQSGLLEEEADGLRALADTATVNVPVPLHLETTPGGAVLLLSLIEADRATDDSWRSLGEDLAALHRAPAGARYGYHRDNHLGHTPQPNHPETDWVVFNQRHRLGHQVQLARRHGYLDSGQGRRIEHLVDRLDRYLPRHPAPALLHGDLWSGNALPTRDAAGRRRVALIDPAVHVGDGWADIAMMRLFGGFSMTCFDAYRQLAGDGEDHDVETRIAVYQLYHVLNHVNLFGGAYVGQAMGLLGRLGV